jgi:hypothetical protein
MAERHAAQAPVLRERVHHSMFDVRCWTFKKCFTLPLTRIFYSRRDGRTFPDPPPEAVGLDQAKCIHFHGFTLFDQKSRMPFEDLVTTERSKPPPFFILQFIRSHLKKRKIVRGQGRRRIVTGGIYVNILRITIQAGRGDRAI